MGERKRTDVAEPRRPNVQNDPNNRSGASPAHWQGEPLPRGGETQTQDIGFDHRGSGRGQQYGRAGDYGDVYEEREERPQRGPRQPDDFLLEHVQEVFSQSGLNVRDVAVRVSKGIVCLEGYIDEDDDRYVLERLAVNCRGTVGVENRLEKRSGHQGG